MLSILRLGLRSQRPVVVKIKKGRAPKDPALGNHDKQRLLLELFPAEANKPHQATTEEDHC